MAKPGADHDSPIRFRDLIAGGAEVTEAVFDALDFTSRAPSDRPYVVLNMIATVDGRAALDGRTAMLGSAGDRRLFHRLRAQVDAIMVGAATVRMERYGPLIREPALRELRAGRGQADPVAVIVSASLRIDPTIPLLADPQSRIVVLTPSRGELDGVAARVEYLRGEGGDEMRVAPLLARLRREHGIATVLCEGGPTLNDSLLLEDLVDELFLTVAPKLIGGPAPLTIVSGAVLDPPLEFELAGLLELEGNLFCRYRRAGRTQAE